nr:hypothetical protein [uncultured bacterium]
MNEASQWRLEVARYVAPIIARNPKVQAIALTGSASRGNADSYSDIEIGVFWSEAPSEAERMAPIEPSGGIFWELDPYNPEENVWMEEWGMGGVKMDMRNLTVEGLERILSDVTEAADTTIFKHETVSAIQHAIPLYNPPLLERWQAQIAVYPPALAQAKVRQHLALDAWCWWVEMLAKRGDLPLVYYAFSEASESILSMLMGLNGIYHPGMKWMHRLMAEMALAPQHLARRIQEAFQVDPLSGMAILRDLRLETYDLIDLYMPEVETADARLAFLKQRPQIMTVPEGIGSLKIKRGDSADH